MTGRMLAALTLLALSLIPLSGCAKGASVKIVDEDRLVSLQFDNSVRMELVKLPGGSFAMGSPPGEQGRDTDEGPRHPVRLNPFAIGRTEVTWAQYEAVMGLPPYRQANNHRPVQPVTWLAAVDFCNVLSAVVGRRFRLPTEAEWEYSCRAGSAAAYCFGDSAGQLDAYAWLAGNSGDEARDVGTRQPNSWGLYDMHGNVWEWCADWYGPYTDAEQINPNGPPLGNTRVLRGGSGANKPEHLRSAKRFGGDTITRYAGVGFRIVMDIAPSAAP